MMMPLTMKNKDKGTFRYWEGYLFPEVSTLSVNVA